MASLSIRRIEDEVVERLRMRANREALSVEETVRRILRAAVENEESAGAAIRRIVGNDGYDLRLPDREPARTIDFTSDAYGDD